jgi:hypothetical protein
MDEDSRRQLAQLKPQRALQEHNAQLQRDSKLAELNRGRYFRHHWEVLKPFVAKRGQPKEDHPLFRGPDREATKLTTTPLLAQPSFVTGQMRPHQLDGLNWLLERFDNVSEERPTV